MRLTLTEFRVWQGQVLPSSTWHGAGCWQNSPALPDAMGNSAPDYRTTRTCTPPPLRPHRPSRLPEVNATRRHAALDVVGRQGGGGARPAAPAGAPRRRGCHVLAPASPAARQRAGVPMAACPEDVPSRTFPCHGVRGMGELVLRWARPPYCTGHTLYGTLPQIPCSQHWAPVIYGTPLPFTGPPPPPQYTWKYQPAYPLSLYGAHPDSPGHCVRYTVPPPPPLWITPPPPPALETHTAQPAFVEHLPSDTCWHFPLPLPSGVLLRDAYYPRMCAALSDG